MIFTENEKAIVHNVVMAMDVTLALLVAIITAILLPLLLLIAWGYRFLRKRPKPYNRIRLILTSGSHLSNSKRNIRQAYEGCLLNDFFKNVYFVYFLAEEPGHFKISKRIQALDFRSLTADRFRIFHFNRTSRLFQEIFFLFFMYSLIRKNQITHLESNDPYIEGLNILILSKLTGVPYFVRANCDYGHYYKAFGRLAFPVLRFRWIEKVLEKLVFYFAEGTLALYGNYLRYARESGARWDRSVVATPILDPLFFSPPKTVPAPKAPFKIDEHAILLYLGRVSWDKYALDLIEVMAEVKKEFPSAKLVILGGGELLEEFQEQILENNLTDQFYLPGPVPNEEILAWGNLAHLALATHGGFSLIELGGLGLPVVAYDYEWHWEIIRPNQTGVIVPFRNAKAMADASVKILKDPNLRATLSDNYRSLVEHKYQRSVAMDCMQKFFELVEQKRVDQSINIANEFEKVWSINGP